MVSSFEYSIDHLSTANAIVPTVERLKDSITFYRAEIEKVDISILINVDMLDYLESGTEKNVSESEQGLGIEDLIKTMDY